jgi:hypothetical protein
MTRSNGLVVMTAMVLSMTAAALAVDISGTWTAEFDTQVGVQKYAYTFKTEGEKLTGTAIAERMGERVEVVPITYRGKIVGGEIKFTRKVGDFATEELVAKRKKP